MGFGDAVDQHGSIIYWPKYESDVSLMEVMSPVYVVQIAVYYTNVLLVDNFQFQCDHIGLTYR